MKRRRIIISVLVPTLILLSSAATILILKNLRQTPADPQNPETPETTENPDPTPENSPETAELNPTLYLKSLMLINPSYPATADWLAARSRKLVDLTATYGTAAANPGTSLLLDPEAAPHFYNLLRDYSLAFPGHSLAPLSCFSAQTEAQADGSALATSDAATGYSCDLIDPAYGTSLDANHPEWTWLADNSTAYGFIRLSAPWHFRYVTANVAAEIATGRFSDGAYDTLEHYLEATNHLKTAAK